MLLVVVETLKSKSSELRTQHLELSLKQRKVSQQYDETLATLQSSQQQYKELDGRYRTKVQIERELTEKLEDAQTQVIALLRGMLCRNATPRVLKLTIESSCATSLELDETKSEIRMARQIHFQHQDDKVTSAARNRNGNVTLTLQDCV
jgi:chromosome segregation ATPase